MSKEAKIVWKYVPKEAQERLQLIINQNVKHRDALWMIEQIQFSWTRIDLLSSSILEIDQKYIKKVKRKDDIK